MSTETDFPSDKADKYVVRFPDGMREMLKQAAAQNNRSMNAEIVARLENSLKETKDLELQILSRRIALLEEDYLRKTEQMNEFVDTTLNLLKIDKMGLIKHLGSDYESKIQSKGPTRSKNARKKHE